jgi:hypothetical protein
MERKMADRKPISTAPKDGSKVTVYWTDGDGVQNESIAQYRSPGQGNKWDAGDTGWWAYIDGQTQKRIEPSSWRPASEDDED